MKKFDLKKIIKKLPKAKRGELSPLNPKIHIPVEKVDPYKVLKTLKNQH